MVRPCVARELSSSWRMCGLASMYPAFDWSLSCSGPSWISAREPAELLPFLVSFLHWACLPSLPTAVALTARACPSTVNPFRAAQWLVGEQTHGTDNRGIRRLISG